MPRSHLTRANLGAALTAWIATAVLGAVFVSVAAAAPSAGNGTQECERRLALASGKYWSCVFRARANAASTGAPFDGRWCEDRIGKRVEAIRKKFGASCPAEVWTGGAQRFVDLGDGTVRDRATGLQWEKKQALDGKRAPADPHDADNVYTWTTQRSGQEPNGTLFTSFLAALNGDGGTKPCFAQHCDWRLPSLPELRSILLTPKPCDVKPCIDPVFGPTATAIYWTGEESVYHLVRAWYVFFISGMWTTSAKNNPNFARAVRDGRAAAPAASGSRALQ